MNNSLIREFHYINQNYNFIICGIRHNVESGTLTFQLNASGYNNAKLVYDLNEGKFEDVRKAYSYLSSYRIKKIIKLESDLKEAIKNLW